MSVSEQAPKPRKKTQAVLEREARELEAQRRRDRDNARRRQAASALVWTIRRGTRFARALAAAPGLQWLHRDVDHCGTCPDEFVLQEFLPGGFRVADREDQRLVVSVAYSADVGVRLCVEMSAVYDQKDDDKVEFDRINLVDVAAPLGSSAWTTWYDSPGKTWFPEDVRPGGPPPAPGLSDADCPDLSAARADLLSALLALAEIAWASYQRGDDVYLKKALKYPGEGGHVGE